MNEHHGGQLRIGTGRIDGVRVEFVWAPGTRFLTAQFMDRSPRGIANLYRIDTTEPVVVPMSSHRDWLSSGDRAAALVAAGRACFVSATDEPCADVNRGSPPRSHAGARGADRNCGTAFRLINGRGARARTR